MKKWILKDINILNKISAIITSGGNSTRFGSNKLLEKLDEYSVIETTISKFLDIVDEIIIPCQEEIKNHILNSSLYSEKIKFAPSGSTRQISVYNGIFACSNPKIVLIHDGARPFINKKTIEKTIEMTLEKKAVVVGNFTVNTIKMVENGKIIKTLDRKKIFEAQTPQAFEYELIKNIHSKYKNKNDFTDDSSMAEAYGTEVFVLENEFNNIKITTKKDLENFSVNKN